RALRLDAAHRSREAVRRRSRPRGPVAIQKHSRALTSTITRHADLIGLCLYGLIGSIDFAYHLTWGAPRAAIWYSNLPVAFSAAVFWPVGLIAMAVLARL